MKLQKRWQAPLAAMACAGLMLPFTATTATLPAAVAAEVTEKDAGGKATVSFDDDVTSGSKLTIKGEGWINTAGDDGSTVAIKLSTNGEGSEKKYYERPSDILKNPKTQQDDPSLWALVKADKSGKFETTITMPEGLTAGQKLVVDFNSGLIESDGSKSIEEVPLTVDGKPYEDDAEVIKCVTDTKPTVEVADTVSANHTLHVTGKGWCNRLNGGKVVAFKIDDGRIARLKENKVDTNLTTWYKVEADPHTGEFDFELPLPDGTTSGELGSKPAFTEGAHTLRILAGQMKKGDRDPVFDENGKQTGEAGYTFTRNFVYGEYKPSGVPDPVAGSTLDTGSRKSVSVKEESSGLRVTIPGAKEGDWIYASAYKKDGSPTWPWDDQWYQADAKGTILLPTSDVTLPSGDIKIVVQSGNKDKTGELLGWAPYTVESSTSAAKSTGISGYKTEIDKLTKAINGLDKTMNGSASATPTSTAKPTTSAARPKGKSAEPSTQVVEVIEDAPSGSRVVGGGATTRSTGNASTNTGGSGASKSTAQSSKPKPSTIPPNPVSRAESLTKEKIGKVKGKLSANKMFTVTFPDHKPGDWVYVYGMTTGESGQRDYGWVQLDDKSSLSIDASGLGAGEHKFAFVGEDGKLIGWSGVAIDGDTGDQGAAIDAVSVQPVPTSAQAKIVKPLDWALIIGAIALVQVLGIGAWAAKTRRSQGQA